MGCGAEDLIFLRNSAAELRKLGAEWGLTEDEIVKCIEDALSRTNKSHQARLQNSPKNVARKWWRYFLVAVKAPIYLLITCLVLILAVLTATTLSDKADKVVSQALQPYGYDMLRALRLAFLPIHQISNLTQFYNAECLIDNPFYTEPEIDCLVCKHFKRVKEINASDFTPEKFAAYTNTYKPALLKRSLARNVTYTDLKELYLESTGSFEDTLSIFESTVPEVANAEELFSQGTEELLNSSTSIQIHWQTKSVKASASLRRLFPRPTYLPEKAEIMLEKHLLFDGKETPTYELPNIATPTQLYTLASGKRRVLVRPISSCKSACNSMLVFMEAGDSLMYQHDMYRLFIAANQHEPSLAYLVPYVV